MHSGDLNRLYEQRRQALQGPWEASFVRFAPWQIGIVDIVMHHAVSDMFRFGKLWKSVALSQRVWVQVEQFRNSLV